jgi:hypothetical protein
MLFQLMSQATGCSEQFAKQHTFHHQNPGQNQALQKLAAIL